MSARKRSTQRSFRYYMPAEDSSRLAVRMGKSWVRESFYVSLLRQDLSQQVLPYGTSKREAFTVEVEGTAPPNQQIIADAIPSRYAGLGLESAIRDFFEEVATLFVLCGSVAYELCFLFSEPTGDAQEPARFQLLRVQPGSLDTLHGDPIQYVPDGHPHDNRHDGLAYVRLDRDSLVTFRPPAPLDQSLREAVSFLAAAGDTQRADLALLAAANASHLPYDAAAHRNEVEDLITDATAPIGWNARREIVPYPRLLEPYMIYRQLRFLEVKVRLREAILDGLNETLRRAGDHLGFDVQLALVGLASLADVDAAQANLAAGTRSLRDLFSFATSS
jgi:hypothetical protein